MRKVICLQTGEIFRSVVDAAASVGLDRSAIYKSINTGQTAASKNWAYAEEQMPDIYIRLDNIIQMLEEIEKKLGIK